MIRAATLLVLHCGQMLDGRSCLQGKTKVWAQPWCASPATERRRPTERGKRSLQGTTQGPSTAILGQRLSSSALFLINSATRMPQLKFPIGHAMPSLVRRCLLTDIVTFLPLPPAGSVLSTEPAETPHDRMCILDAGWSSRLEHARQRRE